MSKEKKLQKRNIIKIQLKCELTVIQTFKIGRPWAAALEIKK